MKAEARVVGPGEYVQYQRLLAAVRDGRLDAVDDQGMPRGGSGLVHSSRDHFDPLDTREFDPLFR